MMNRKRYVFRTVSALLFFLLLFFFGISAGKAEEGAYTITVDGGYATDGDGNRITKAEPGTRVILVCEVHTGQYLMQWDGTDAEGKAVLPGNRRWEKKSGRNGVLYEEFSMPESNVRFTARKGTQTPVTIDLREGYWETSDGDIWTVPGVSGETDVAAMLCSGAGTTMDRAGNDSTVLDLNGDGSWDIYLYAKNSSKSLPGAIIIPTNGCSVTDDIKLEQIIPGPAWPVTIRFGAKPTDRYYTVKAEHGTVVDSSGTPVKSAAPGAKLYLIPKVLDHEYVVSWKNGEVKEYFRFTEPDPDKIVFRMPRADVNLTAVTRAQQPLEIDLSKGFYAGGITINPTQLYFIDGFREQLSDGRHYRFGRLDIDGDSADDVIVGCMREDFGAEGSKDVSVFFIPLTESRVQDFCAYDVPNGGAYRPVVFRFGKRIVAYQYSVNVTGGYAVDAATGEYITKAKPGTRIRLVGDEQAGKAGTRFTDLQKEWDLSRKDAFGVYPSEVVMSAHDMEFAPSVTEGATLALDFTLRGDSWECSLSEESLPVPVDSLKSALEPVLREYRDYEVRIEPDRRIVMSRVNPKNQKVPEPTQLYLAEPLQAGSDVYGKAESHFDDETVFFPVEIRNGIVFTEGGNSGVSGAYAGQNLRVDGKLFTKDGMTYVSRLQVPSGVTNTAEESTGVTHLVMPSKALQVAVIFVEKEEKITVTPTPEPTISERKENETEWKPESINGNGKSRLYHVAVIGGASLVLIALSLYLGLTKIHSVER